MVKQTSLVNELESLVGAANVSEPGREEFAVDGLLPRALVRPGSYEEVPSSIAEEIVEHRAGEPVGAAS